LAMNLLIILQIRRIGALEALIEKDFRDKISKRTKLIFIILEDTPQLALTSMFIINSVLTDDNPEFFVGLEMLHTFSLLGVASSSASIALALTICKEPTTHEHVIIRFVTTFLSVG
ncbi:unnamed protein product, partial [Meganyctiphanes norvegica]